MPAGSRKKRTTVRTTAPSRILTRCLTRSSPSTMTSRQRSRRPRALPVTRMCVSMARPRRSFTPAIWAPWSRMHGTPSPGSARRQPRPRPKEKKWTSTLPSARTSGPTARRRTVPRGRSRSRKRTSTAASISAERRSRMASSLAAAPLI